MTTKTEPKADDKEPAFKKAKKRANPTGEPNGQSPASLKSQGEVPKPVKETKASRQAKAAIEAMFPEDIFTPTSFAIPEGTSYETWAKAIMLLEKVAGGIQFWLGDALRYGDRFGEQASQASSLTGIEPKTLMEYRRICDRIDEADRIPAIGWTSHKYAADYLGGPEGSPAKVRAAIKYCFKHKLNSSEMMEYCREKSGRFPPAEEPDETPPADEDPTRHQCSLVAYVDVEDADKVDKIMDRAKDFVKTETGKLGMKNVRVTVSEK